MTELPPPIPPTLTLIKRLRRPVDKTTFDRVERWVLISIGALIVIALFLKGLLALGVIPQAWRSWIGIAVMFATYALGAAWIVNQIANAVVTVRLGQDGLSQSIDDAMAHEARLISDLAAYNSEQLERRADLLEISAKRMTRHTTRVGLLAAAGAIIINLHNAGHGGSWWPRLDALAIAIYAGSIGIAISSILLIGFVSSIERLSRLLHLAAHDSRSRSCTSHVERSV